MPERSPGRSEKNQGRNLKVCAGLEVASRKGSIFQEKWCVGGGGESKRKESHAFRKLNSEGGKSKSEEVRIFKGKKKKKYEKNQRMHNPSFHQCPQHTQIYSHTHNHLKKNSYFATLTAEGALELGILQSTPNCLSYPQKCRCASDFYLSKKYHKIKIKTILIKMNTSPTLLRSALHPPAPACKRTEVLWRASLRSQVCSARTSCSHKCSPVRSQPQKQQQMTVQRPVRWSWKRRW